ncbi:hypothetical protein PHYBOEH_006298 [Phytophthora boehmeriae]|uniref:Uncharacterized protein n=1 Tax=Phytophthora boehmeriae TaxID=109152 RepID=A0A8T1WFY5_9STRA|nr:hypothetical protein PHYBOEH_006298 [Phytophthora boehmeriae]
MMQTRSWNKRRWGFLAPWCAVLKPLIRYSDVHGMTDVWDACEYLEVALPRRELKARRSHLDNSSGSDEGKASDSEEKEFLIAFQKVREALALLAAVEHVDEDAWKHLLTTYCKVDMGREGEEKYEKVPVRFLLTMDLEGITNQKDQKKVHFDLVHFCGVHQREHPSPEYAKALRQIATLDNSLTKNEPGVDIEIPVKVHFPGPLANIARPLKNLLDVGKAERVIKNQWEKYACKKQDVEPGSLRCTFVLEPMDISFLEHDNWCSSVEEMADTMERLVLDNVRFSQISSLAITRDDELEEDEECRWKKAIGLLLMRIFDSTCRPAGFANTTYRFENTGQDPDPLQVGMLEVYCADNLTLQGEFAAMCSALVVNQMTRQLLLSFDESPEDPVESAFWWKWMAYALFSKRAHACSALTSLRLLIGRMTSADIEALSAVLASSHPEEELCNRPRGKVEEKSAILRAGAPIRSEIDDSRQTAIASGVITLPSPISTVRTFSDDGKSEWVDAIISGYGRCQEAIRTIFAFAAIPVLRQVYFRVDNNGIDWSSELGQLLA